MAGQEKGDTPVSGKAFDEIAYFHHALGVQPVHGFIQENQLRVIHQCSGDAQSLLQAQRVCSHQILCPFLQPHHPYHIINFAFGNAAMQIGGLRYVLITGKIGIEPWCLHHRPNLRNRLLEVIPYAMPADRNRPRSGRTKPRITRTVVVLPTPLGLRKPNTSPGATSMVTSFRIGLSPNDLYRFFTSSIPLANREHPETHPVWRYSLLV